MNLDDLSPELKEKAKNCSSMEEVLELAKQEGMELTQEDLEAVAGGRGKKSANDCPRVCPGFLGFNPTG